MLRQALREDAPKIIQQVTPISDIELDTIDHDEECIDFLKSVSQII